MPPSSSHSLPSITPLLCPLKYQWLPTGRRPWTFRLGVICFSSVCISLCSSPFLEHAHCLPAFTTLCESFLQPRSFPLHRLLIAMFKSTRFKAHLKCHLFHNAVPTAADFSLPCRAKQCAAYPVTWFLFGFLYGGGRLPWVQIYDLGPVLCSLLCNMGIEPSSALQSGFKV